MFDFKDAMCFQVCVLLLVAGLRCLPFMSIQSPPRRGLLGTNNALIAPSGKLKIQCAVYIYSIYVNVRGDLLSLVVLVVIGLGSQHRCISTYIDYDIYVWSVVRN